MTKDKTVTMSRELIERIVKDGHVSVAQLDQMRQTLAAPVVERQELAGWQRKSKHEDGRWFYLPDDDVEEAIRLGYEVRKVYTSPPAPVAVVLPTILSAEQGPHYSDNRASELGYLAGYNACLDKVKELNQ